MMMVVYTGLGRGVLQHVSLSALCVLVPGLPMNEITILEYSKLCLSALRTLRDVYHALC